MGRLLVVRHRSPRSSASHLSSTLRSSSRWARPVMPPLPHPPPLYFLVPSVCFLPPPPGLSFLSSFCRVTFLLITSACAAPIAFSNRHNESQRKPSRQRRSVGTLLPYYYPSTALVLPWHYPGTALHHPRCYYPSSWVLPFRRRFSLHHPAPPCASPFTT